MSQIKRFGIGNYMQDFSANARFYPLRLEPESFEAVNLGLSSVTGMDGGMPDSWQSRGASAPNDIRLIFRYAWSGVASDLAAFKKSLHTMKRWGYTYLFKTLDDDTLVWTWAHCKRVQIANRQDNTAHFWPSGEVEFQCPTARWYGKTGMVFLNDAGHALDGTMTLIAPQIDRQTVTDQQTIQLTNNGDADAGVYIWFEAPAGQTVANPSLKRLAEDGSSLADHITYNATLNANEVVVIDARKHQVQENMSVSGDYSKLNPLRASWLQCPPGTHNFIVEGTFSSGMILTLDLWDTYY